MVKIFIDPGHGGNDSGAVANGLKEKDLTLSIAKRIKRFLDYNYNGHTTRLSRTSDKTVSLSQRTNDANSWGAEYFLSVHINAGGGTGYEDYIYNGAVQKRTATIRDVIHDEVIKQISNVTNRGKKRANLHVTRESRMPAVLTENLFIDTKADADKLKDNNFLDKLAKGHGIGLAKAFNLKSKSGVPPETSKPSKASKPGKPQSNTNKQGIKWIGTDLKGKRIESIYRGKEGLHYYDSARWSNPSGTFGYGQGWKIDNKYLVDGSPMYRVQNSKGELYFITASSKYVKVINSKSSPSKQNTSYKVGSTVTLKKSATHFATGQPILNSAKGKKYNIIQVKSDRVLLDKIMSWVKKSDVQ